jgi:hypothetical protein
MYKLVNNKKVEMTAEENAAMEKFLAEQPAMPVPEPTAEERLAALEQAGIERDAALMELAAILAGGV